MVPHDLVPWGTAWSYFRRWREDGTWQHLHDSVRADVRRDAGRDPQPSAAILDSQSVKTVECVIRAKTDGRFGGSRTRKTVDGVQPKRLKTYSGCSFPRNLQLCALKGSACG